MPFAGPITLTRSRLSPRSSGPVEVAASPGSIRDIAIQSVHACLTASSRCVLQWALLRKHDSKLGDQSQDAVDRRGTFLDEALAHARSQRPLHGLRRRIARFVVPGDGSFGAARDRTGSTSGNASGPRSARSSFFMIARELYWSNSASRESCCRNNSISPRCSSWRFRYHKSLINSRICRSGSPSPLKLTSIGFVTDNGHCWRGTALLLHSDSRDLSKSCRFEQLAQPSPCSMQNLLELQRAQSHIFADRSLILLIQVVPH